MHLLLFTIRNIYCYTLYYKFIILNDRKLNRYIYSEHKDSTLVKPKKVGCYLDQTNQVCVRIATINPLYVSQHTDSYSTCPAHLGKQLLTIANKHIGNIGGGV